MIPKLYSIIVGIREGYSHPTSASHSSQGTMSGGADEPWLENSIRYWLGLPPVTSVGVVGGGRALPEDANCTALDSIAQHVANVFSYTVNNGAEEGEVTNGAELYDQLLQEAKRKWAAAAAAKVNAHPTSSSLAERKRRQYLLDRHLPLSYLTLDVDRVDISGGTISTRGREQLIAGERKCSSLTLPHPQDDLERGCTWDEVKCMVHLGVTISKHLNQVFQLPREASTRCMTWESIYHRCVEEECGSTDGSRGRVTLFNSILQRWKQLCAVPHAVNQGFRFNFRWIGNIRVCVLLLLLCIRYLVLALLYFVLLYYGTPHAFARSVMASNVLAIGLAWFQFKQLLYEGKWGTLYV